ncbi:MAG: hypothetical protein A2015_04500 [Spirochaetes bacterium GWF1_31_7]|nr:MAG: hypothetical protein A2Y30_16770 [Spirochaetes bacterium GWE1_32_154]OHD51586.1 MAG: hypothetical protein A2Y29_07515 [Spirochaetes bacterium GWE2_31_10]OHD52980.1 MAG: hypothetical protein A2015_04500 [Spirochaetes bacterium GWF1_31_7]OHD82210.1 MAG: hypothetical protein A2355_12450 [Spirochaetes bacterium RIFOXYB1_FULL_32_8]HBD93725.1 hypothetical protein [Spirochaetia bacterium]
MNKCLIISMFLTVLLSVYPELYTNDTIQVSNDFVVEKNEGEARKASVKGRIIITNYDGVDASRTIPVPAKEFPQFKTGYPIIDILYDMAIEEIKLNTNTSGFFVAGEKWNQAWTRDMSYAIFLGLSSVFNKTSIDSLRTRIYNGNILQDTGTGGSYPISTDRMSWVMAAYETALASKDMVFYNEVYNVSKKAMLQDIELVFDTAKNLFKGEQSFLDWREQTYPRWMTPGDIGESFALGTNVNHFIALSILSNMASTLGLSEDKNMWDRYKKLNQEGINTHLWSEEKNHWAAYLINGVFPSLYEGYETLGVSLAILSDLKDTSSDILNRLNPLSYGLSVVSPQLKGIPPYHNNSVWPFVQGYRGLSAAKLKDMKVFSDEFFTLVRSGALFLTFKENLVASNGNKKGTQINSDRQLWSVASYLGFVYRGLIGMSYSSSGIHFNPVKPQSMTNPVILKNFTYRDATIDVEVIGTGCDIESILVNGKKQPDDYILPINASGTFSIKITLKKGADSIDKPHIYDASSEIKVIDSLVLSEEKNKLLLKWTGVKDKEYLVFKNGQLFKKIKATQLEIAKEKSPVEYSVAEDNGVLPVLKGNPVWTENKKGIIISEVEQSFVKGGEISVDVVQKNVKPTIGAVLLKDFNRFSHNGKAYIEKWGGATDDFIEFTLKASSDGDYLLRWRFMNGGPVNTGEKCSIKELSINSVFQRFIYFPHTGNWREWQFTSPIVVHLNKGANTIKIYNSSKTYSQKEYYPIINIDLLKAEFFK